MSRATALARNPRLLFWGRAMTEAKTLNAFLNIFYLARGVTFSEIFVLSLVYSLTCLVSEIPTGYLADRFGRKRTMMLGVFFLILSNVGAMVAHGFPQFALLIVFLALAGSCFSGTEEALLYDTLKEIKQEHKMSTYYGRLFSARSVLKIFLPAIGALIASGLLEWQFLLLIAIDALASLAALWLFSRITEPKHQKHVLENELGILRQSIETIREHPVLFKVSMNKTLIFIGGVIMWRAYQPIFVDAGITAAGLALFYFLMHGITFVSRYHSGAIEQKFGLPRLLVLTGVLSGFSLLVFLATETPWLMFVSMLLAIVFEAMREPLFSHAMNSRIASRSRATTLSNLNILKGVLDIPILLLCAGLAATNQKSVLLVVIAIIVIALIFFPVRKRDLATA